MRIAAGVVLIVAAIFSIITGVAAYFDAPKFSTIGSKETSEAYQDLARKYNKHIADSIWDEMQESEEYQAEMASIQSMGDKVLVFGLSLWIVAVFQIIGSIFLFINRYKTFVFLVAAISLIACIAGFILAGIGTKVIQLANFVEVAAFILAFFGAASIGKTAADLSPAGASDSQK